MHRLAKMEVRRVVYMRVQATREPEPQRAALAMAPMFFTPPPPCLHVQDASKGKKHLQFMLTISKIT